MSPCSFNLASNRGWAETDFQICSLTTSESGLTTARHCQLDGHDVSSGICTSFLRPRQRNRETHVAPFAPRAVVLETLLPRSDPLLARPKQSIETSPKEGWGPALALRTSPPTSVRFLPPVRCPWN